MLEIVVGSAIGTLLIAGAVQMALWTLRIRQPKPQLAAWTAVLIASTAMPAICLAVATCALPPHQPFGSSQWLTGCYVFVATLLLLRLMRGLILSCRMLRATRPVEADWAKGRTLCEQPRTSRLRTSKLRTSTWIGAPVTIGSHVLLPAECVNWDARKRRAVLAHETAHAARRDFYVQLLSRLHCAVVWFNPLSWWLHHRLTALSELASDDAAIEALGNREAYAAVLREIARLPNPRFIGVTMARPATIRRRVARIMTETQPNPNLSPDQQSEETYREENGRHPVARNIRHCPVVQFRTRVSHQNEWQMLPVV
jgi:beta-lactamase regulating signal transducer with metallopeptidase domain